MPPSSSHGAIVTGEPWHGALAAPFTPSSRRRFLASFAAAPRLDQRRRCARGAYYPGLRAASRSRGGRALPQRDAAFERFYGVPRRVDAMDWRRLRGCAPGVAYFQIDSVFDPLLHG